MGQRILSVVVALGLLTANSFIQPTIDRLRLPVKKGGEGYGPPFNWVKQLADIERMRGGTTHTGKQGLSFESVSFVVVLGIVGGFRSVAADVLWLKSDEWWHKGKADRMIPLLNLVTMLDPNFIDGWKIAGWHWAYNLRVQAPTPDQKEECMRNGLDFLKRGVAWNRERHELYFEVGWTNQDKVGDMQEAAEWYERALPLSLVQGLTLGKKDKRPQVKRESEELLNQILSKEEDDLSKPANLAMNLRRESLIKLSEMDKAVYSRALKLTNANPNWTRAPSPDVVQRMMAHSIERMPDIPAALRTYNILLNMSPDERRRLTEFVELAERANMDVDEFQQALELHKAKPDPKHKLQAKLLRHPELVPASLEAFTIIPELRKRDTVASGATLTIMARYAEADELFRANKFEAARQALLRSYQRFFSFQREDNRKQPLELAEYDAFWACEQSKYDEAAQILKRALDKEPKGASTRQQEALRAALEALQQKDYPHATILLQASTVVDTIYSHLMARIYEKWADELNKAGKAEAAKQAWRNAFQTWIGCSNHNASDHLAANRVRAIAATLGLHIEIPEFETKYDPRHAETMRVRK